MNCLGYVVSTYLKVFVLCNLVLCSLVDANPSGCSVLGVGLRPLACWDCGFETCKGHGCLSVVSVVCCQVEVSVMS
jgi:hypothetical protein